MIRIISKVKYQGKCDGCGIGITWEKGTNYEKLYG